MRKHMETSLPQYPRELAPNSRDQQEAQRVVVYAAGHKKSLTAPYLDLENSAAANTYSQVARSALPPLTASPLSPFAPLWPQQ